MNFLTVCVLLSVVVLVAIRAQCPNPLSDDSIKSDVDNTKKKVKFTCKKTNERIAGTENKNSINIKCKNNKLKEDRPCCEKKKCGPLPAGRNTEAVPKNVEMVVKDEYTYKCLPGYVLLNTMTLKCQADLTYSPTTAPACIKRFCRPIRNGINTIPFIPSPNLRFMDVFAYKCIPGFTTNDPLVGVCTETGDFSISPPNCNLRAAPCTPNPCVNGGTCSECVGGFTCECPPGFLGDRCQDRAPDCRFTPCLNGGVCDTSNGFGFCRCAPGYTGGTCATDINECASAPCKNGGICIDRVNSFSCTCTSDWSGPTCEVRVCLTGWKRSPAGNCYYFSTLNDRRFWDNARTECVNKGGSLVILRDGAKRMDLKDTALAAGSGVAQNLNYWIGGGQVSNARAAFIWIDFTPVNPAIIDTPTIVLNSLEREMLYSRFSSGQPDQIFYVISGSSLPYICEQ